MESSIEEKIEEVKALFYDDRLREAFNVLFQLGSLLSLRA